LEQIDLVVILANQYSRWSADDEFERNEKLARFPYSVQVATSFMEMDFVEECLTNVIGPKRISWEVLFYYKQDYDFGYAEYFFHAESFLNNFQESTAKNLWSIRRWKKS
jgi:hypothetical protein